jgi:hypothetical protein
MIHPVLLQDSLRIDMIYGGDESSAMDESIKITRDYLNHIESDQPILYINTLVSRREFEMQAERLINRHPKKRLLSQATYLDGTFMDQLRFFEQTIRSKGVRLVLINSFEFAAKDSRTRAELMFWIKKVRDELNASVILFSQRKPSAGALGALRYMAKTVAEVGAYKKTDEARPASKAVEEAAAVEVSAPSTGVESEAPSAAPRASAASTPPLKTKDLQPQNVEIKEMEEVM